METIETERLILRPLCLDDADAIQVVFPHFDIVQYMSPGIPWPFPADGAQQFINEAVLPGMRKGTDWWWSIRRKLDNQQLIGLICLSVSDDDNRGFWIGREWQNNGYATEAATAVTNFWFGVLGQKVLRVPKASKNIASRRISETSGMRVIKKEKREYVSGWHETEIWEITQSEWNSQGSN